MITIPRLFRPAVSLIVAGQPVAALNLPGVQAPRVAFRVVRTMTPTPDNGTVTVWGLDQSRRVAMQQIWSELGRATLEIATGYDNVIKRLFLGDVRSLRASVVERPEIMTIASADDGGDAITDATIPSGLSSTAAISAKQMIDLALAVMNAAATTPIVASPSVAAALAAVRPEATTLFYTAVSVGKATDLLNEAARTLGVRWWIRDAQLFMVARRAPVDGFAIVLPRTHWLSEPDEDGAGLVRVATFLDPNLVPGRQVVLVGRDVPGVQEPFRIEAAEYSGDTRGGAPFRADLVLRRPLG